MGFAVAQSDLPGPREALDATDAGLYCGPNDYFLRTDTPFDFFIVPAVAYEGGDNSKWNDWLLKARESGKRVIVDLIPQVRNSEDEPWHGFHVLDHTSEPEELDRLLRVVDEFYAQVDVQNLYAMTLGEEHVFWDGKAELLSRAYEVIKPRHDIPVYQWYSPSSAGSVPGLNWPNIPADGWVADEYHLDAPIMEQAMRGFVSLRKPVVMVSWGGGDDASVPYIPERLKHQVEMTRKYGVPHGYFTHNGTGGAWGWSDFASDELKARFEWVKKISVEAESLGATDYASWDTPGWEAPVIDLAYSGVDDLTGRYVEKFEAERGVRFANESLTENFADLKWDSSPVMLCPRRAGEASAAFTYRFDSTFAVQELRVEVDWVRSDARTVVAVSVLDEAGDELVQREVASRSAGTMRLRLPGKELGATRFDVKFEISGTADQPGVALGGVASINIEADVQTPDEKVVDLSNREPTSEDTASGEKTYHENLASMSLYHTANISDAARVRESASGLHAFPGDGVLAVVQKVRVAPGTKPTKVLVTGSANVERYEAHFGVGVSLDGVQMLAQNMTTESYSGELELPLQGVADQLQEQAFYIHLLLDGGYGGITDYTVVTTPSE